MFLARPQGWRNKVWETDHVQAPVLVDIDGKPRRPWITWFTDCATNAITGIAVTPGHPSRGTAVEPVPELREVAQGLHTGDNLCWVADALPGLNRIVGLHDLVLLSAVWMHLEPAARGRAMQRLADLLAPSGLLMISLRRGSPPPDRVMFDIPAADVIADGQRVGLRLVRQVDDGPVGRRRTGSGGGRQLPFGHGSLCCRGRSAGFRLSG
ncbi:hypothetical protein GCM10010377_73340 [Streptomyces viridiviolaceus]|uniref:Class I SAM-dependent methyltransferase n=1 Tax=Streptomyces viridiviolaceus TaxID=68282 RepID=A0ABW2DYR0_9ACTN|nr:class I SAM-dependent methyltransferase [Streptomyces viridiviolaceus]GHB72080.1 hypothetical protein GCM10010377_73340 [Streptomyces viridiviolaceus]